MQAASASATFWFLQRRQLGFVGEASDACLWSLATIGLAKIDFVPPAQYSKEIRHRTIEQLRDCASPSAWRVLQPFTAAEDAPASAPSETR